MTHASKLHDLIQGLPDAVVAEVVDFAEFLRDKRVQVDALPSDDLLMNLAGGLETSANFIGDPVTLQGRMRDEWN